MGSPQMEPPRSPQIPPPQMGSPQIGKSPIGTPQMVPSSSASPEIYTNQDIKTEDIDSGANKTQGLVNSNVDDEDEELVIYLTYNIQKEVSDMNDLKKRIINGIKRVSHIEDVNSIMIGNPTGTDLGFRKGKCTYSFEVTIVKSTESFDDMKDNISDSINDGSFDNIMNIDENIITLRDVYFTGLNGYLEGGMLRYKRGLADIKLPYPQGGQNEKIKFSKNIKKILYDSINSLFEEFNLSKGRIQLELISAIDDDESSVLVQFMIMDSYSKLESSYSIAKTISENLSALKTDVIQEINMLDKCRVFDIDTKCNASKKKLIDLNVKKVGMQKDSINIVNNNCSEIVKNLRNNYVSNMRLSENCSDAIDKELGIDN